jgi:hypothetical protein
MRPRLPVRRVHGLLVSSASYRYHFLKTAHFTYIQIAETQIVIRLYDRPISTGPSRVRPINRRLQRLNVGIARVGGSRDDVDLCGLGRDSLECLVIQDRACGLADFEGACSITGKQRRLDVGDVAVRDGDLNLDVSEAGCDVLTGVLPVLQWCRNLESGRAKTATSGQSGGAQDASDSECAQAFEATVTVSSR